MKRLTFILTLLAICCIIGMTINGLMVPLVGLMFGIILSLPLAVTLTMSKLLRGTTAQSVLLVSTFGYFAAFVYLFPFGGTGESGFNFTGVSGGILGMALLWLAAGFTSQPSLKKWESRFLALRRDNERDVPHFSALQVHKALESLAWKQAEAFQDTGFRVVRHARGTEEIFVSEQSSSDPKLTGSPAHITEVLEALKQRQVRAPLL